MGEEYKEGRKDEKSGVSPHRTKSPPSGVLTGDAIGGRMVGLRGRTSFASRNKRMTCLYQTGARPRKLWAKLDMTVFGIALSSDEIR